MHWNLGNTAKGSERRLERHKSCHFKVNLALLKVDNLDFAENAFHDGVIDRNSESDRDKRHGWSWHVHLPNRICPTCISCIVRWIACKPWSICCPSNEVGPISCEQMGSEFSPFTCPPFLKTYFNWDEFTKLILPLSGPEDDKLKASKCLKRLWPQLPTNWTTETSWEALAKT